MFLDFSVCLKPVDVHGPGCSSHSSRGAHATEPSGSGGPKTTVCLVCVLLAEQCETNAVP